MEESEESSRDHNFSPEQNTSLCRAYIAISEDPLIEKINH